MGVRLVDFHPITATTLQFAPIEKWGTVMSNMFIDGSSGATKGLDQPSPPTSSCVIHEYADGGLGFGGYSGMIVGLEQTRPFYMGASKTTNGVATLSTSAAASLRTLQNGDELFKYWYAAT